MKLINKETVVFLTNYDSTVNLGCLDLSNAFDKVNHIGLLLKLMQRNIPIQIVILLKNWYSKASFQVVWHGELSRCKLPGTPISYSDVSFAWVQQIRYLGVYFVNARRFTCNYSNAERNFVEHLMQFIASWGVYATSLLVSPTIHKLYPNFTVSIWCHWHTGWYL